MTKEQEQDIASKQVFQKLLRRLHQVSVFCLFTILAVSICYVTFYFCGYGYRFGYQVFGTQSMTSAKRAHSKVIIVTQKDTMKDVAEKLQKKGLITNAYSFYLRTRLMSPSQIRLVPGHHRLNTGMNYTSLLERITQSA